MPPASKGRTPSRRSGPSTITLIAVGAAAVVVAIVVWVAARDGDDNGRAAVVHDEPGVEHVHGLGINPADGSLIVATHFGSFRIAANSDEAVRIGASFQDTMGFTVAGADHFLGSGHPDVQGMQAGQPTRLGLIESTDGGETWRALSLSGEVDFHGLAFAHDQVYGWDSGTGRFMVSTDRRAWETRATVDLFGFAVDPDDADHIIGGGRAGLLESTDGGRNWTEADGPQLVAMGWHSDAGLWGADPTGAVWHRDESRWARAAALPGEPQAFLVTGDVLYAAAHDTDGVTGIYQSTDAGRSWKVRYRDADQ